MRPLADQKLIAPAHPADSPFDAPPRVAQVRLYARPEVPFVERVARLALGVSMFLTHMVYYGMLSHYVTSMRWQRGPPMIRSMFALRHWRSEALIAVRVTVSPCQFPAHARSVHTAFRDNCFLLLTRVFYVLQPWCYLMSALLTWAPVPRSYTVMT